MLLDSWCTTRLPILLAVIGFVEAHRIQPKSSGTGSRGIHASSGYRKHTALAENRVRVSGTAMYDVEKEEEEATGPLDGLAQLLQMRGGAKKKKGKKAEKTVEESVPEAEEVQDVAVDLPVNRIRVRIAEGDTGDSSLCEMSPADLEKLQLETGDFVELRGMKQRKTLLVVVADDKLKAGEIRVSSTARSNTKRVAGEDLVLSAQRDVGEVERILVLPFASSLKSFDGDAFEEGLKPFLTDNMRPLTKDNVFETPVGEGKEAHIIRWKVMEVGDQDTVHGIVGSETEVFMDADGKSEITEEEEEADDEKVGYEDVGSLDKALSTLRELIDLPLKHPAIFEALGVRPPRGVLLHGPAGSGKTMVARAIESETGVNVQTINGPEIMSQKSGDSEAALRQVFETAERESPSIIFIDEIDAIAAKRGEKKGESEQRIVSQLLTLLDGIKPSSQVVVLGATNKPNLIDPALRRFGRFDREIDLGMPDVEGRLEILKIKTKKVKLAPDVDLQNIADDTHGYCGADLAQLVTEAAMQCVREKSGDIDVDAEDVDEPTLAGMLVSMRHFEYAMKKTAPSSLRDKVVEIPDCSWADVGGLENVKREMMETLQYPLKYSGKFARYGMAASKGMLLYGPPGCGKTLVVKAIANECQSNFLSVKGPELLSMWFGESEANVRELFDKARGAAPCILFFDEIDSIAKPRGSGHSGGGEAGDRIVNQILTEIDGVGGKKSLFVIAATNRPDMLDPAVMRPGRLDQLVYLPPPDHDARLSIFKAATRKSPLAADVSLDALAERTDGFSGADITEVCQRACKLAIRQNIADSVSGKAQGESCAEICKEHFSEALSLARKSISPGEVKKFDRFRASMLANKG